MSKHNKQFRNYQKGNVKMEIDENIKFEMVKADVMAEISELKTQIGGDAVLAYVKQVGEMDNLTAYSDVTSVSLLCAGFYTGLRFALEILEPNASQETKEE